MDCVKLSELWYIILTKKGGLFCSPLYSLNLSPNYPSTRSIPQSPQITYTTLVARTIIPHIGQQYRLDPFLFPVCTVIPKVSPPGIATGIMGRSFRYS